MNSSTKIKLQLKSAAATLLRALSILAEGYAMKIEMSINEDLLKNSELVEIINNWEK